MGLLFVMPVNEIEVDRVQIIEDKSGKTIILKSYGLPLVFWGYLAAILIVILAMLLTVSGPLKTMLVMDDEFNRYLAYLVILTLFLIPGTLIGFLFYEKFITKKGNTLVISHRLFWITIFKNSFELKIQDNDAGPNIFVEQFQGSPNLAKIEGDKKHRAFQNQGYYFLKAKLKDSSLINIDRHSRKADLLKISETLMRY